MHTKLNKYFLVIFIITFSNLASAQSVRQAVDLMSNAKYDQAFKMLVDLSQRGDAVAQYNLGLMFANGLGREQDKEQAKFWFSQAAAKGLAEAYNQIQDDVVKPAIGVRLKTILTPKEWVKAQKPGYYTLQLASSTNEKLIEKYYLENNLQGIAGYYKNRRQGEDWYALVYGAYPSVSDANEAVASLPADLKKWSPWVRKLKVIQRLMDN